MKKNILPIIGIVLIFGLVVSGVAYGEELINDAKQVINNYYGDTVVEQSDCETLDGNVVISDQAGGFVVTKKITYSDIATTTSYTGLDITNTITGALVIEDIIVSADNTSIGSCTGLRITTDASVNGSDSASTTIMAITAVASIAGNETIDFKNADTAIKTRLEEGINLQILPTGNICTGSGEMTLTMYFSRVDQRSHIYE